MQTITVRQFGIKTLKVLLLTAFLLPSLVPAGFMADRDSETGQFEITLCPSGFSESAMSALTGAEPGGQSHHAHHMHFAGADEPAASSGEAHHEGETAELCSLAGPGVNIADTGVLFEATVDPLVISYLERPVSARAPALLPPPVRGPPNLT